jgi:two-component system, OmpR family, phosphate regulon response regulator PhoB
MVIRLAPADSDSVLGVADGPDRPPVPSRSGSGPYRRPVVLLVDDDPALRDLFGWCMRAAGWFVEEASNAQDALIVAHDLEPDAIVLDMCMPGMGGLDALRLLKESETLRDVPVAVCTASTEPALEAAARDAGCAAFVRKPCDAESLRAVVRELVDRRVFTARRRSGP